MCGNGSLVFFILGNSDTCCVERIGLVQLWRKLLFQDQPDWGWEGVVCECNEGVHSKFVCMHVGARVSMLSVIP